MMLTWIAFVLGSVGLVLTALAAEICRYGYIPAEEEVLAGSIDPLSDPNLGCDGINAERLWSNAFAKAKCTLILMFKLMMMMRTRRPARGRGGGGGGGGGGIANVRRAGERAGNRRDT